MVFVLRDVRKAALIACAAAVLTSVMPMRDFIETLESMHLPLWWTIAMGVPIGVVALGFPVFYFELYREGGTQPLSPGSRRLCIAGALALLADLASHVPAWIGLAGSGAEATVPGPPAPWTMGRILAFVPVMNLAYVLPLLALAVPWREAVPKATDSASKLLQGTALLSAFVGGVLAVLGVFGLVLAPVTHAHFVSVSQQTGHLPPELSEVAMEPLRRLLNGFGLFAAPYVVWRSGTQRDEQLLATR